MKGMKKELGKYLLDISKLVFGGVILSAVIDISENKLMIIAVGFLANVILALAGFLLIKLKK